MHRIQNFPPSLSTATSTAESIAGSSFGQITMQVRSMNLGVQTILPESGTSWRDPDPLSPEEVRDLAASWEELRQGSYRVLSENLGNKDFLKELKRGAASRE
jgi:hypothetical protein